MCENTIKAIGSLEVYTLLYISFRRLTGLDERIRLAVAQALADRDVVDRYNPFVRSHHSDSASSSRSSGSLRKMFKRDVAEYYGLTVAGNRNELVDMLGVQRSFGEVILAHIWPAALMDAAHEIASDMMLPDDFHTSPRNYLLLPKDLRDAFDSGSIAFVPSRDSIVMRDFRGGIVSAINGQALNLPRAGEGRVPFKRLLSWFAWVAKGNSLTSGDVLVELESLLGASANSRGNDAVAALVEHGVRADSMARTVNALTLAQ